MKKEDRNFYITIFLIVILIIIVLLSGNIYKNNNNNKIVNISRNNLYDEISYLEDKLNDFGDNITNVILPKNKKNNPYVVILYYPICDACDYRVHEILFGV